MTLLVGVVLLGAVHVEALSDAPRTDRAVAGGPGAVAHVEARTALPTFIWGEDGPSRGDARLRGGLREVFDHRGRRALRRPAG